MSERSIETCTLQALAIKHYSEGTLSLGKAAKLAEQTSEQFIETLAASDVDVVDYPPSELDEELAAFR